MTLLNRRQAVKTLGAAIGWTAAGGLYATGQSAAAATTLGESTKTDSLPMQLYKSLSEEQKSKICLPINHPRRQYVSNWWYIHPDHRIPTTFNRDQQALIKQIFDSMHSADHQDAVNKQVLIDQYGEAKNAPAAGFFGSPDDDNFEFIFTGHHVTRRCNAHTDKGRGFGGAPIFYGHYPHDAENMRDNFNEAKDHPGNPYWYQGRNFNRFVQSLDAAQQAQGLVEGDPRSESPSQVIKTPETPRGLPCAELSADHKRLFLETVRGMLAMFRPDDVEATLATMQSKNIVDRLHVSWYPGKYDIGNDRVWDTWQIEGPDMVWYFRGEPHIHCYFHLKTT